MSGGEQVLLHQLWLKQLRHFQALADDLRATLGLPPRPTRCPTCGTALE